MTDKVARDNLDATIAQGALVNMFGILGKLAHPLFFIVITQLYGPEIAGAYYLAGVAAMQLVLNITVSGFNDGIQVYAIRALEDGDDGERELYRVLANGFVITIVISAVVIAFAQLSDPLLHRLATPDVVRAMQYLSWGLPLIVIPVVVTAATKALLIMKWEAILSSGVAPLSLLIYATIAHSIDPSLDALIVAFLASGATTTTVALVVFSRYFSFAKLGRALLEFRGHAGLVAFSLPQSLNMTFNTFITKLDVLMLAYFRFPKPIIAFYAMGAELVLNIRQIKLAFSGIYSPIITKLHKRDDGAALNDSFSRVTSWIITFAIPAALVIALFRTELLQLFHGSFGDGDTTFMLYLLIPPLVACSVGLAANVLVMTGHVVWNLINSITIAVLNAGLNYLLIPDYGLEGAAIASAISATGVAVMQVVQAYRLEGVHLVFKGIYKPIVAALPAIAVTCLFASEASFAYRLAATVAAQCIYAGLLWSLGVRPGSNKS